MWNGTWNGMWNGTWNGTCNRMARDLPRVGVVRTRLRMRTLRFCEWWSCYSVPHEESRKMFFVHFASFLQNQMSYGHVLCTIMIPIVPDSTESYGFLSCDGHVTQEACIYHRVADNFWLSFSTTAGS